MENKEINSSVEGGAKETSATEYKPNIEDKFRDWLKWWPWAHEIFCKYEEIWVYLVVGVLTTIVAWGAMFLFSAIVYGNPEYPTSVQNFVLSTVNWVSGVIFGYFTNRKYVFRSHGKMLPEAVKFVGARVSTWVLDVVLRQLLGNVLGMNVYVVTIIDAVLVTIANYVFSKIFVFSKKKK